MTSNGVLFRSVDRSIWVFSHNEAHDTNQIISHEFFVFVRWTAERIYCRVSILKIEEATTFQCVSMEAQNSENTISSFH